MDFGAFVQENKRWLLGCAIGAVVFFVAKAVIGSVYDPEVPRRLAQKSAQVGQVYDRAALQAATAEQQSLQTARQQLQQELTYVQDAAFQLEGKAMTPDEYLGKIGRERKVEILRQANEREVVVADKDLQWPPAPQGVDEIRGVLFGIELVEALSQRLFAAHDQARHADPLATGLVSFGCKVDPRQKPRANQRPAKQGEVDVREFLDQQRVTFDFKSDEATAFAFVESLRQPGKTLVLEAPLKMTRTERRNDPVAVTGSIVGIAFKEK